jgi:sugar phosphate permease
VDQNYCNDFQYSITISAGIGFIFLGNIYDNVERPRQVTVLLLIILAIISLIEALFALNSAQTATSTEVSLTLYQMSSVFEAGVSLACIVILHNWFKEEILGTVTSIWFAAIYAQIAC